MSLFSDALDELAQARSEYRERARTGPVPPYIEARRIAALRRVHYLECPSIPCGCRHCRIPAV